MRTLVEVNDNLEELTPGRLAAVLALPYRAVISAMLSEAELRAYAASRGYRDGWVWHRLREQEAAA